MIAGKVVLGLALFGFGLGSVRAPAQTGCTLKSQVYTCNRAEFVAAWSSAGTVGVETQGQDRMAAAQLREMVARSGKTVGTTAGTTGELIVLVAPADTDGVMVGPAGVELATLRVYRAGAEGKRGNLVWAESYMGQPDMSWPAVVHALVSQFEGKFGRK